MFQNLFFSVGKNYKQMISFDFFMVLRWNWIYIGFQAALIIFFRQEFFCFENLRRRFHIVESFRRDSRNFKRAVQKLLMAWCEPTLRYLSTTLLHKRRRQTLINPILTTVKTAKSIIFRKHFLSVFGPKPDLVLMIMCTMPIEFQ